MKRVYIASASRGGRYQLKELAYTVAQKHFVFVPCLGFVGLETPEIRLKVMDACYWLIAGWAEVFLIFWEGIESEGIWREHRLADTVDLPLFLFNPLKKSIPEEVKLGFIEFSKIDVLLEVLSVL